MFIHQFYVSDIDTVAQGLNKCRIIDLAQYRQNFWNPLLPSKSHFHDLYWMWDAMKCILRMLTVLEIIVNIIFACFSVIL